MDTNFAPAQKSSLEELQAEIRFVSLHPVINTLLRSVAGVLAVLNKNRQVITVNADLLRTFGFTDASELFGLRLGEIVECRHSKEEPAGCGTTKFCQTCGAAIAMMICQADRKPADQKCCIEAVANGENVDLYFKVRVVPVTLNSHDFMIVFLTDMTQDQKWASIERVFFHDIGNLLTGLEGLSELLVSDEPESKNVKRLNRLVMRMSKEIEMQRMLFSNKASHYEPNFEEINLGHFIKELHGFHAASEFSKDKTLVLPQGFENSFVTADYSLLYRILVNMITNAFEASHAHDTVELTISQTQQHTAFSVHNSGVIPPEIQHRIFQRNFSTKNGGGKGIGTYSMKLFGEELLKGKMTFISSPQQGTVFTFLLPK